MKIDRLVKAMGATAALVAVAVCSACGGSGGSGSGAQRSSLAGNGSGNALTANKVVVEYRGEQSSLDLAPGWSWPAKLSFSKTGPDGAPMVYQPGDGKTAADHYWFCSWETTDLAPDASAADQDHAYRQLKKIRKTFYYKVALLPPDRAYFDKELVQAGLGDKSSMKQDVAANCPHLS